MKKRFAATAHCRNLVAFVPVISDLNPPSHKNPGLPASSCGGSCLSTTIRIPGRTSIISNCGILFSLLDLPPIFTVYTGFATAPEGLGCPAPARRRRPLEHSTPPASQQPLGSAPAEQGRGPQNK